MKSMTRLLAACLCAVVLTAQAIAARAEEETAEEQGVQEIQQLLEVSNVEGTEGMDLEELTEAFAEKAMSEYVDSLTGFSMQYPSSFVFDEDQGIPTAYTEDRKASLTIENMPRGQLTDEMLIEAIKLEAPDEEPQRYEQNGCLRVDRQAGSGNRLRTDLYLAAGESFHHVSLEYPAEEKETYAALIEYMINTMETKESEQG